MVADLSFSNSPLSSVLEPPEWKQFEAQVARLVDSLDEGSLVENDKNVRGKISGRQRQIDVLVTGSLAGMPIQVVFECKHYGRAVGIGVVDELVGKLADLGVGHGVLVSTNGFTAPASDRAKHSVTPKIETRSIDLEPWDEDTVDDFDDFLHHDCPNPLCVLGSVSWHQMKASNGDFIDLGYCDRCTALAVRCTLCEDVLELESGVEACGCGDSSYFAQMDRKGGNLDSIVQTLGGNEIAYDSFNLPDCVPGVE